MKALPTVLKRNIKMFFKDKGLFFTSLITPLILLVLYATFLANVYRDSINGVFSAQGIQLSKKVLNGLVGGQLFSSLLAVSCVTVSFCSNMLMVQDKISGARKDMLITPAKRSTLALGYYLSTFISTLIICIIACIASIIYVAITGWFMSAIDIILIIVDVLILTTFGTALSSIINFFLSSQGQISAVGSIVSSCYGFISGAYMPISSFGKGLRNALMFMPGTYGTSLLRNHALAGAIEQLNSEGYPPDAIQGLRDSIDCNLYIFGKSISVSTMYTVIIISAVALVGIYVLINVFVKGKSK